MSPAARLLSRIATVPPQSDRGSDEGPFASQDEADALARRLAAPARATPALADAIAEAPAPAPRARLRVWRIATHSTIAIAGVAVAHGIDVMAGAPGVAGDGLWWLPLLVSAAALALLGQGLRQAERDAQLVDLRHAARLAAQLCRFGAEPADAARAAGFVYGLTDEPAARLSAETEGHLGPTWATLAVEPPPTGSAPAAAGIAAGLVLCLGLLFWGQYVALLQGGLQLIDPPAAVAEVDR